MVREARERECNARSKAAGGLSEEITYLGKELERDQDEAGTAGAPSRPPRPRYAGLSPRSRG